MLIKLNECKKFGKLIEQNVELSSRLKIANFLSNSFVFSDFERMEKLIRKNWNKFMTLFIKR